MVPLERPTPYRVSCFRPVSDPSLRAPSTLTPRQSKKATSNAERESEIRESEIVTLLLHLDTDAGHHVR